jgi:hypothetical protein
VGIVFDSAVPTSEVARLSRAAGPPNPGLFTARNCHPVYNHDGFVNWIFGNTHPQQWQQWFCRCFSLIRKGLLWVLLLPLLKTKQLVLCL